ncbi:MAG: hypothetical protein ACREP8_03800 [Candidatus Binatia bacterium]
MTRPANCAQILRTIGQVIEEQRLEDFEIKSEGDSYRIRDVAQVKSFFKHPLEVRYTLDDITQLEREREAKRTGPSRTPDFTSLSQVLRTVGHYLDAKESHLLGISKRALLLTIEYETEQQSRREEEYLTSSFYDLAVRLYKQREKGTH